jgi:hypothetical protein
MAFKEKIWRGILFFIAAAQNPCQLKRLDRQFIPVNQFICCSLSFAAIPFPNPVLIVF